MVFSKMSKLFTISKLNKLPGQFFYVLICHEFEMWNLFFNLILFSFRRCFRSPTDQLSWSEPNRWQFRSSLWGWPVSSDLAANPRRKSGLFPLWRSWPSTSHLGTSNAKVEKTKGSKLTFLIENSLLLLHK